MQKHVNLVDLVKNFQPNTSYLLANFGFDTAENEPEYEYEISFIFVSLIFGPDRGSLGSCKPRVLKLSSLLLSAMKNPV